MVEMPTIKFSHEYDKLPIADLSACLLDVLVIDRKELHESFIEYDTRYLEWVYVGHIRIPKVKNYPLPSGKVLVLLLLSKNQKRLFTTIRRWTPEKEKYYRNLRGQEVKIEIARRA